MPATRSLSIIVLAEGLMERKFFFQNFPYVHVVTLSNGKSWSLDALCAQIGTKYAVLSRRADRVVVWLDREKHPWQPSEVTKRIKYELQSKGVAPHTVCVCIPDRMTENVILADEELIRKEFSLESYSYPGDGTDGKKILHDIHKQADKSYSEIIQGSVLLKKVRLVKAAVNSSSLSQFIDDLNLPCWWIGNDH